MRSDACLLLSAVFATHFALACGTASTGGGGSNLANLKTIAVTPANTTITVGDTSQSVTFNATGTFTDGSSRDVTNEIFFYLSRPVFGTFSGSVFTSAGVGGTVNVVASSGSVTGQTTLTVTVERKTNGSGAPNNAASLFDGSPDQSRNPKVSTPFADTLIPPNIGMFEFTWDNGSDNNLWELGLSCENFLLKTYLTTSTFVMAGSDFTSFAESCRGKNAQIVVRGIRQGATGVGTSPAVSFAMADENIEGGVYFWSNTCSGDPQSDSAIYRFDFGAPKQAEAYYGPKLSGAGNSSNRCVGCHAVSRDGKSISVHMDGNNSGYLRVLDAASRQMNFSETLLTTAYVVFSPDGNAFINDDKTVLTLYDTLTGASKGLVSNNAVQPDWSPDGTKVVAVLPVIRTDPSDRGNDVWAEKGSIAIISYQNSSFGAPQVIAQYTGTEDNYYPCFTADGGFILFNRASSGDSYGNALAHLMLVPVTGGDPIALTKSEPAGHQRHSWPRVSPFLKHEKGEPLVWFTFSSMQIGALEQQLYMAAIRLPPSGTPIPYASFHLPYQDPQRCNHIAQWTQVVVPLNY